jgi:hypothetical protein
MAGFDEVLLKMVNDGGYYVYRGAVCWKGPPLKKYIVESIKSQNMPSGRPYRIEGCCRSGQTMVAELVFDLGLLTNVAIWEGSVFDPRREVVLVMKFEDGSLKEMPVKHVCLNHQSLLSVAYVAEYETKQAAKAVGSAVAYPFLQLKNGASEHSEPM